MRMTENGRKLAFEEREIVLRADFADLDGECVWVSLRFMRGPRPPTEGELVYLLDRRGRGCLGEVQSVHGWVARVRPDWETWTEAKRTLQSNGGWGPGVAGSEDSALPEDQPPP